MLYVPEFILAQKEFIEDNLECVNEVSQTNSLNYMIMIIIDHIYHHNEEDYDGGLSFLDRLNKKLGEFHPEWNIEEYKNDIRNAQCPELRYIDIIEMMLEKEDDRMYYGV
jgi:hypothetical protein